MSSSKRPASGSPSPPRKTRRLDPPVDHSRNTGSTGTLPSGSASASSLLAPIFLPPPEPLFTSAAITDRSSTFVARLYRLRVPSDVPPILSHLARTLGASHNMNAWRALVLERGKTGLGGPEDFRVESASADDGEQWGGKRILGTMQKEGVVDALVVVSRWYGGVLLGPVRFEHIENCTREVCRLFKAYEEVEELITRLTALDDEIADLRLRAASAGASSTTKPEEGSHPSDAGTAAQRDDAAALTPVQVTPSTKRPSYDRLLTSTPPDVTTAQRLLKAREKTLASIKAVLNRVPAADAQKEPSGSGVDREAS